MHIYKEKQIKTHKKNLRFPYAQKHTQPNNKKKTSFNNFFFLLIINWNKLFYLFFIILF